MNALRIQRASIGWDGDRGNEFGQRGGDSTNKLALASDVSLLQPSDWALPRASGVKGGSMKTAFDRRDFCRLPALRRRVHLYLGGIVFLLGLQLAWASVTGSISGLVKDPTGGGRGGS